jgi:hypothetical protein
MSTNILEELSSITETSDVFIKNLIQDGGDQFGDDQFGGGLFDFFGGRVTLPLASGCSLTVMIMSITLICIIHNNSHC